MSAPYILRTLEELRAWRSQTEPRARIGFVPTMGALHEGHLSLIRQARATCDITVVSIFVNPLQFGPKEDFSQYPRPFEKDLALLKAEGVDALFAPLTEEFYHSDASTYVVEEKVAEPLCGAFRPGHYRGVATVVLKLFNLIQPQRAFFGQKDVQQCSVIERMVRDLNVPVTVVRGATVREADGLALSSRNAYLSVNEREVAPLIHRSMKAVEQAIRDGERDVQKLTLRGRALLEAESAFQIQYWEIRDPSNLNPLDRIGERGALIAVAAYLGQTRLIDNIIMDNIIVCH